MALVTKNFSDIITFTRASTATYFDSAGVLQSAAINAPRFDYNPATLAARGLLIEEQRTNLMLYSEQFDNAIWGPVAGTVTANATTAPSGAVTADRGVTNGVNFQVHQGATITSGATVSGSVFLKADGINEVEIVLLTAGNITPYARATFNVSTGVISVAVSTANGGTNASASITAINNGWYRCVVTVTYPATTSAGMRINAPGATGGIFLWGAQVEAGAFPTSYIPTTTTALTRSADVASVNTLSPWFNSTEYTLYHEGMVLTNNDGIVYSGLGDTFDNTSYLTRVAPNQVGTVISGAVASAQMTVITTPSSGVPFKTAMKVKANDFAFCFNGGSVITDTSGAVPASTVRLGIANAPWAAGGGNARQQWVRRITVYPRGLSSAELQTITA